MLRLGQSLGPVHTFDRSWSLLLTASTAADKGWSWGYSMDDLPSYTEFQNLFMEWRIARVDVDFAWTPANPANTLCPYFLFGFDPQGLGAPTSQNEALQRGYRAWYANATRSSITYSIRPKPISVVSSSAQTGATLGFDNAPRSTWISTTAPGIYWQGLSGWIGNFNSTITNTYIRMNVRVRLQCRGTK